MNGSLLTSFFSPDDLKTCSLETLNHLAKEIRQRIIEVMSVNGGHLASNLGVVELTLALHYVFDSPKDKLIWDVSHQTYVHKLLTARNHHFDTIRQFKGLCGFSYPKESEHDHFLAGHAGTALSLALGMAKARDLSKQDNYVIPIIGDATLTCGLSLEAMNNMSRDLKRFIIILNDNEMSISKNVGAITRILSRLLSNPTTHKIHEQLDHLVSKIPGFGSVLSHQGHKLTESLKNFVSPAAFFEEFDLSYIGPIDGHDTAKMIETFEGIKDSSWPLVVHVLTKKGKGMEEAIKNPISYHGAKPFALDTGKFLPNPTTLPTFPKIFGSHLLKMAEKDEKLVVITPAMLAGSCLDDFSRRFPERCIDVGIAESHAVTYAGGIAKDPNMKVVVSIYATFLQRAFDNLFHDICLQQLPVVFAIDRAGISGPDGSTHHGVYDISFMNAMPNMVIAQPRNGQLLKELLESAFSWKRPAAIRYPNQTTEEGHSPLQKREVGKGEVLIKGKELLIVALGQMVTIGAEVCSLLAEGGIEATLMDPIFVKPIDTELFCDLLMTHNKVVTLEEHSVSTGIGSIINHFLAKGSYHQIEVLNFGIPETFIEHGSNKEILNELGMTPSKIACHIKQQFYSMPQVGKKSEDDHFLISQRT